MPIRFFAIAIVSSVVVGGTSLLWPKFTAKPRPAPLQQVHDVVLGTQLGEQAAETLGVTNDAAVTPINPGQILGSVVTSVVTTVEKRTQEVIVENAVKQLSNQFDQLPSDQKQQIQQIICKP